MCLSRSGGMSEMRSRPPASHAPHTHTAHDLSRLSSFLCLFFHVFWLAAHATHTCMHVAPTHTHGHPHTHIMEGRRANDKGQAPAQTAAQGWLRGPTVKRGRGRRQQDGREVREVHPWNEENNTFVEPRNKNPVTGKALAGALSKVYTSPLSSFLLISLESIFLHLGQY
jgi:hypothetical protein